METVFFILLISCAIVYVIRVLQAFHIFGSTWLGALSKEIIKLLTSFLRVSTKYLLLNSFIHVTIYVSMDGANYAIDASYA